MSPVAHSSMTLKAVCVCMSACVCAWVHVCVCMYACMHACMCMYTCVFACVCVLCRYTCICMPVATRAQSWLSFIRDQLPCFNVFQTVSSWPKACHLGCGAGQWDPGIQMCPPPSSEAINTHDHTPILIWIVVQEWDSVPHLETSSLLI